MYQSFSKLMLAGVFAVTLQTGIAKATDLFDSLDTCLTTNCNAQFFNGTLNSYSVAPTLKAGEYAIKLWSAGNSCLRFDVVNGFGADLELNIISPNPAVTFINDDRTSEVGACGSNCPLVKVNNTVRGYYTLVLHHWAGAAINSDFSLAYGQYNISNAVNCANPTPPQLANTPVKNPNDRPEGNPDE